eukprot:g29820.t1
MSGGYAGNLGQNCRPRPRPPPRAQITALGRDNQYRAETAKHRPGPRPPLLGPDRHPGPRPPPQIQTTTTGPRPLRWAKTATTGPRPPPDIMPGRDETSTLGLVLHAELLGYPKAAEEDLHNGKRPLHQPPGLYRHSGPLEAI